MTLYQLTQGIEEALEGAIDPETGEIIASDLFEAYEELQLQRDEKIENIGLYIKNLEADAKAIREEEKALASRRRTCENKAESLKQYLQFCLQGEKFNSPRLAVSFRRSQKVEVDENRLNEVPEKYLRHKDPEVDKTAVKEALKSGQDVPGCRLVDNVSMIIK